MKHEETEAELAAPALGKAFPIAMIAVSTAVGATVVARKVWKAANEGTVKEALKLKKKEERKNRKNK